MELDRRGAELLFQVLTEREERSAVAIASNEPFSGWTKTFTDPRLCAAIVDRLTFAGQIIETGTASYRLAHARKRRTAAADSRPDQPAPTGRIQSQAMLVTDLHHFLDLTAGHPGPGTAPRPSTWPTSSQRPPPVTPAPRGKAPCRADADRPTAAARVA